MDVNRLELFADQSLRINRLLIMLLVTKEAITALKLANALEVSKDTIMNDLDELEHHFQRRFSSESPNTKGILDHWQ